MGLCFWLITGLVLVGACCAAAVGFLVYRRMQEDDDEAKGDAVGEETFDHFARMASENSDLVLAAEDGPPEEMNSVTDPLSASPSPPNFRGESPSPPNFRGGESPAPNFRGNPSPLAESTGELKDPLLTHSSI